MAFQEEAEGQSEVEGRASERNREKLSGDGDEGSKGLTRERRIKGSVSYYGVKKYSRNKRQGIVKAPKKDGWCPAKMFEASKTVIEIRPFDKVCVTDSCSVSRESVTLYPQLQAENVNKSDGVQ